MVTRPWLANSPPSSASAVLPPDEAGQLHREVVGVAVEGAQRREVGGEVWVAQLVDLDRDATGQRIRWVPRSARLAPAGR